MRFDSFVFLLFFVPLLFLYWRISSVRIQNILLVVASYVFYGWWDWRFLSLIALSTIADYTIALRLENTEEDRARRRLVFASILLNLSILGIFKYCDFFLSSLVHLLESFGLNVQLPLMHVVLPVGISFYTFQTMGYTVDVYRKKIHAEPDFVAFGCYVAFFPQLVAGPIERAQRLLPQLCTARNLSIKRWRSGLTLILFGLIKKTVIADNLAPFVDWVYGQETTEVAAPLILAATLAFAFQIYADFSGYTDMARGLAQLLGIELCINFNQPYLARTPTEFWRRWHISLSSWLRDYLYIPLGGNRGRSYAIYRNLMITMILGGLWHGASWNFVLWGCFHGILLCLYRVGRVDDRLAKANQAVSGLAWCCFWALTLYGWLLFRAQSMDQIRVFTLQLFLSWSDWSLATPMLLVTGYFSLPILLHHFLSTQETGEKWTPSHPLAWRALLATLAVYGITHARANEQAFIYFQF